MRSIRKYYLESKGTFALIILAKFFNALLQAGLSMVLYFSINYLLEERTWQEVLILGTLGTAYMALMALANFLDTFLSWSYVAKMTENLRMDLIRSILSQAPSTYRRRNPSEYISFLEHDVQSITNNHFYSFFEMISQGFVLLISVAISFYLSWIVTLIELALSLIILITPHFFLKSIYGRYGKISEATADFLERADNALEGGLILMNSDALPRLAKLLEEDSNEIKRKRRSYWFLSTLNNNTAGFFCFLLQFVAAFAAGVLAMLGKLSIASPIAFLTTGNMIYNPLGTIVASFAAFKSVKRVIEKLLSIVPDDRKGKPITSFHSLEAKGLSITRGQKEILKDASFRFEEGKGYWIAGESGAGKSTLLDTLIGYNNEYEGEILFDGVDIRSLDPKALNDLFAYCHQKPFLFHGSIEENVTMFEKNPDKKRLESVLHICKLERLIGEKGLDTKLNPKDNGISYGEMQRLSLARALYLDRPILLLDEVTSSLDPSNAADIYEAIGSLKDKTIFWVSHQGEKGNFPWIDSVVEIKGGALQEAQ